MEVFEEDLMLNDHINKCRCCFRLLLDDQKAIPITKAIEGKFHELTNIELIEADIFSSRICQLCNDDLEVFHNFRLDLIHKQQKLYSSVMNQSNNEIKSEDIEFIAEEEVPEEHFDVKYEIELAKPTNSVLSCSKCNFIGKSKKLLRQHENEAHQIVKSFFCDKCEFSVNSKEALERHMKSHMKRNSKSFLCGICGLNFIKLHLLNRHIKYKHTSMKERNYSCTFDGCEKSFFTVSALKKHSESHNLKELVCQYCGKRFSCLNNLRSHLYYHSEPKFTCDIEGCGKKFFMRKLLKAHLNVHRGQKDFQCNYCDKSYFFQAHLKRHIVSSHMRLKIDCELCSSSFARKETYRHHVLNHHQNIGDVEIERLLTKIRNMKVEDFKISN